VSSEKNGMSGRSDDDFLRFLWNSWAMLVMKLQDVKLLDLTSNLFPKDDGKTNWVSKILSIHSAVP
jgi:hypothetical protein